MCMKPERIEDFNNAIERAWGNLSYPCEFCDSTHKYDEVCPQTNLSLKMISDSGYAAYEKSVERRLSSETEKKPLVPCPYCNSKMLARHLCDDSWGGKVRELWYCDQCESPNIESCSERIIDDEDD